MQRARYLYVTRQVMLQDHTLNDNFHALVIAEIPAIIKPFGMVCADGKQPDSCTGISSFQVQ